MYVRAAAERSLSGTPVHLLLVDGPNRAVSINRMFHARLEPLRAFVSSYPTDGILQNSAKCSRPINGILGDTTSAFTDQPRLCCRKHSRLQHHLCFRAMINLQPRIRWPRSWCYRTRATSTSVDPTTNSKRHALLSACVRPLSELLCSPFPFLTDFDLRETFFCRPSSHVLFFGRLQHRSFGRLQHGLTFGRLPSQPSNFPLSVYLCYVPTVVFRYSLLWERIVVCFRVVSVSMWYLLLHVFI